MPAPEMLGEGGLAAEAVHVINNTGCIWTDPIARLRFPAVWNLAHIGPAAIVNAAMPSQARGLDLTSAWGDRGGHAGGVPYIGKTLAAAVVLATVRFFTGVGPNMYRQRTALNEAFDATGMPTMIWSFVGMNPVVSLQIRFPVEALFGGTPSAHSHSHGRHGVGSTERSQAHGIVLLSDSLWAMCT
jgi:hypothetical protein